MNDEQRKALVDSIAKRIDTFAEHVGYGDPDVTRDEAASYIAEIEEALLADRAATAAEPDVETIARTIQAALDKYTREASTTGDDGRRYVTHYTPEGELEAIRAAISAMPAPDDNWLDDALDSVHRDASVRVWLESPPEPEVGLPHYFEARLDHDGPFTAKPFYGQGPTRRAAIEDAVQKAKEAGSE